MNKSILLLSALCLLIVASCKRPDDIVDPGTTTCLLTERTKSFAGIDGEKFTNTYDADGKITSVKVSGGGVPTVIIYTYSASKITAVRTDEDGSYTSVYSLDAQGRIVTESLNGSDYRSYSYNADGYLIELVEGSSTTKYSYTDGNLTKVDDIEGKTTKTYTYGTDLFNINFFLGEYFSSESPLAKYFGKSSKNLPIKYAHKGIYGNEELLIAEETYSYQKDAQGNIVKVVLQDVDKNLYTSNLKYTCK